MRCVTRNGSKSIGGRESIEAYLKRDRGKDIEYQGKCVPRKVETRSRNAGAGRKNARSNKKNGFDQA